MPLCDGKSQFAAVEEKIPYPATFPKPGSGAALSVVLNTQSEIFFESNAVSEVDELPLKRPSFGGLNTALKLVKASSCHAEFSAVRLLAFAERSKPGLKKPISATLLSGTGDPLKNTFRSALP